MSQFLFTRYMPRRDENAPANFKFFINTPFISSDSSLVYLNVPAVLRSEEYRGLIETRTELEPNFLLLEFKCPFYL